MSSFLDEDEAETTDPAAYDDDRFVSGAELAEAQGLKIVYSKPDELFLDFDPEEQLRDVDVRAEKLAEWGALSNEGKTIRVSKSGRPHRHVRYTLTRAFTPTERILMQMFLGSDPIKEGMAFKRILTGVTDNPIRLFMTHTFDETVPPIPEPPAWDGGDEDDDLPF